jgi:hypothetical protein
MTSSTDMLKSLIDKASTNSTASADLRFYIRDVRNIISCEFNGGLSFLYLTVDNTCIELTTSAALDLLDASYV